MSAAGVLVALALFQVKHYLADFYWQTGWMVRTKGRYGHPGGLAHSGLHGVLSMSVLLVTAHWMPALIVALVIFEMIVHYHIDWFKSWTVVRGGIGEHDSAYWKVFGLDQAAHQLTYIGLIAILIAAAG